MKRTISLALAGLLLITTQCGYAKKKTEIENKTDKTVYYAFYKKHTKSAKGWSYVGAEGIKKTGVTAKKLERGQSVTLSVPDPTDEKNVHIVVSLLKNDVLGHFKGKKTKKLPTAKVAHKKGPHRYKAKEIVITENPRTGSIYPEAKKFKK